ALPDAVARDSYHAPHPTEPNTPPLHDALPISRLQVAELDAVLGQRAQQPRDGSRLVLRVERVHELVTRAGQLERKRRERRGDRPDRKSTRLNSSHVKISYAVFCLKKKTITANR